jgi:hypothetical protein
MKHNLTTPEKILIILAYVIGISLPLMMIISLLFNSLNDGV